MNGGASAAVWLWRRRGRCGCCGMIGRHCLQQGELRAFFETVSMMQFDKLHCAWRPATEAGPAHGWHDAWLA